MGSIPLGTLIGYWGSTWSMGVVLRSCPFSGEHVKSADIWGMFADMVHLLDDVLLGK